MAGQARGVPVLPCDNIASFHIISTLTIRLRMKFPYDDLPPGKRMAFLIQDVARLLRSRLDQAAQESGLTSAQWRVLAFIGRCQQLNMRPLNQAELAEMLDVEPITLSRQIDRLAATGLIERRADPNDRRAYRLHLTKDAAPLVAAFRETTARMLADAFDGIPEAEVEQTLGLLERLRGNLTGKTDAALPAASGRKASATTKESA